MSYKLIAFDLDGTFLKDDKTPPEENLKAIEEAYKKGIVLVPTTGRVYSSIPAQVRDLPYFDYCIMANGAAVYDIRNDRILHADYIEIEDAMPLLDFLDTMDTKYDGFQNNQAYMNKEMYDTIEEYTGVPEILTLIKTTRVPVDDLRTTLRQNGMALQKVTTHFRDQELRHRMLRELPERFPQFAITTSIPNNIEINNVTACKGRALEVLGKHLGIELSEMVTFGDGLNDISMIEAAGLGVAMENGAPEVKAAADEITDTNNHAGVAKVIRRILSEQ